MLTYIEVRGLYVNPDTGFFRALDHVNVATKENSTVRLALQVTNPTKFDANVKILSEDSAERSRALGQNYLLKCNRLEVPAGSAREVEFKKQAHLQPGMTLSDSWLVPRS